MTTTDFNVSVIIPVYNAEKFITEAVESVLIQTGVHEIILIEDGSKDLSLKICMNLANEYANVKLYTHPNGENRGAGASRNLGIIQATAKYIAFLDADDIYLPNRFVKENEFIEKNNDFDAMYGALGNRYHNEVLEEKYKNKIFANVTVLRLENEFMNPFESLSGFNFKNMGHIHLNTLTINLEKLKQMSYFFNDTLRLHQDTEFIIRLSYHIDLTPGIIDTPITIRGVHESNRITKFTFSHKKYYQNQLKAWESLLAWAEKEKISAPYLRYFKLRVYSLTIATLPLAKAWAFFAKIFTKHFSIVKYYKLYYKNLTNQLIS
ncbi:glycosyltransferase [Spirosoma sp. HMF4905]|uniref:Glycosyltransferase n=1 Tax=Spirosoma arboris TaxID=2682092 RepID=A0A7K1SFK8_9BACT|nr:glycosyltransferase family A protein [Spirosoma arboris]MVM32533.1 glycosyltransferase [Spirosoma arboris]